MSEKEDKRLCPLFTVEKRGDCVEVRSTLTDRRQEVQGDLNQCLHCNACVSARADTRSKASADTPNVLCIRTDEHCNVIGIG